MIMQNYNLFKLWIKLFNIIDNQSVMDLFNKVNFCNIINIYAQIILLKINFY